jgi:hypothetical protein
MRSILIIAILCRSALAHAQLDPFCADHWLVLIPDTIRWFHRPDLDHAIWPDNILPSEVYKVTYRPGKEPIILDLQQPTVSGMNFLTADIDGSTITELRGGDFLWLSEEGMGDSWAWLEFTDKDGDRFAFVVTLRDIGGPLKSTSGFQMMFVEQYDDGFHGFIAPVEVGYLFPEVADGE